MCRVRWQIPHTETLITANDESRDRLRLTNERRILVGSSQGAVSAFPLVCFPDSHLRTGRASWPRIRLSTCLCHWATGLPCLVWAMVWECWLLGSDIG